MDTSLTVFVCGTRVDLADERKAALEAIRRLQLQYDSMEYFGARSDAPIETCLKEVRRSNIITVIVGHCYGSLAPGMKVSFSEAEYNEAYRLHKTCLVYLRDDDVPILPKYFESNPENLQRLQDFKSVLGQRHTIAKFRDANDLALKVKNDLSRTILTLEQALKIQAERTKLPQESAPQQTARVVSEALDKGAEERKVVSVVRQAMSDLLLTEGLRRPIVYFSYTPRDSELATALGQALRAEGAYPRLVTETLEPGRRFVDRIEEGLDSIDAIAVFISGSLASWQNAELGFILQRRLSDSHGPLAVAVLTGDAEIPPILRDNMYFDLRDGDAERVAKGIVASIRNNL
jgi:hypothetical protein